MIDYELFLRLYREALDSASLEYYIAERGWQEWMDPFTDEQIVKILKTIYSYANKSMKEVRKQYYSRTDFCQSYGIPLRTVENWETKENNTEYAKSLVMYTFFIKEQIFQSTLPQGERHHRSTKEDDRYRDFNPRSRKGSDGVCPGDLVDFRYISIHAPARGATESLETQRRKPGFQSTLPQGERRSKRLTRL